MRRGLASKRSGKKNSIEREWHKQRSQGGSSCDMLKGQKLAECWGWGGGCGVSRLGHEGFGNPDGASGLCFNA